MSRKHRRSMSASCSQTSQLGGAGDASGLADAVRMASSKRRFGARHTGSSFVSSQLAYSFVEKEFSNSMLLPLGSNSLPPETDRVTNTAQKTGYPYAEELQNA